MRTAFTGIMANVGLALASCLGALVLCEALLRGFYPKYQDLAAETLVRDPTLLFVRTPNHRRVLKHPDKGEHRHPLFYNNFGARQHRNFSAEELGRSVNVAFFGDSYTENVGIEAPFSFTEPLDYLLNLKRGARQGARPPGSAAAAERGAFNVLNFGVAGYGTAQSLLRYEGWRHRETLHHVFYVYWENDLEDNAYAGLFDLDDAGRLERRRPSGWTAASVARALVSELHLSYLALDAVGRLSKHFVELSEEVRLSLELAPETNWVHERMRAGAAAIWKPAGERPGSLALFRALLRRFKGAVEGAGATFHLVWLPLGNEAGSAVAAVAAAEDVATLNLYECYAEHDPSHLTTPWDESPYRFVKDWHWNEAGNRLAAVCLHRYLEGVMGLPPLSADQVAAALNHYYSAFDAGLAARLQSGHGLPAGGDAPPGPTAAAIRGRYAALTGGGRSPSPELGDPAPAGGPPPPRGPWVPAPDKLVARAHFDVYLHDGWLALVREGCAPADFEAKFFLHLVPVQARDLPPERWRLRFTNHDFQGSFEAPACKAWQRLPSYPLDRLRTGQFVRGERLLAEQFATGDRFLRLWEVEVVLAQGHPAPRRLAGRTR